jgi:hypothetical protein
MSKVSMNPVFKSVILSSILLFSLPALWAGTGNPTGKKVRTKTGYTYLYKEGKLEKKGYKSSLEIYDNRGLKTEEIYIDGKGEFVSEMTFSYSENGLPTKNIGLVNHKPVYFNWAYETDPETGIIKKYHADGQSKEYWLIKSTVDGKIIREEYYSGNSELDRVVEYRYNALGNCESVAEYDGYLNLILVSEHSYENGRNTQMVQKDKSGSVFYRAEFSYDDAGNLKSKTEYGADENPRTITVFLYDYYQN